MDESFLRGIRDIRQIIFIIIFIAPPSSGAKRSDLWGRNNIFHMHTQCAYLLSVSFLPPAISVNKTIIIITITITIIITCHFSLSPGCQDFILIHFFISFIISKTRQGILILTATPQIQRSSFSQELPFPPNLKLKRLITFR